MPRERQRVRDPNPSCPEMLQAEIRHAPEVFERFGSKISASRSDG